MQNKSNKIADKVKQTTQNGVKTSVALGLLICLSTGFVGGWLGAGSRYQQSGIQNPETKVARQNVLSESQVISEIAKTVGESVVSVNVVSNGARSDFFGYTQNFEQQSAGTGFIVSKQGIIVTNRHVVPGGASKVSVTLSDGTEITDVEVIGRTADSDPLDVAFLKIKDAKGKELKPVTFGESSKTQVGDKAIAIGNALGQFQNTVTAGIISGFGRNIQASDSNGVDSLNNLFQTDAAINQGNSGGPLVNINGEVIGINTAVAGGAENIGFAIPIDDVKGLISTVIDTGKLSRPYLGVRYVNLTDDYAYEFNLDIKRGAYIVPSKEGQSSIIEGSPAQKAGLKEKDIITKINGEEIGEKNSLVSIIGRQKVGEEVSLTVVRDGKQQEIKVKLEAMPEN